MSRSEALADALAAAAAKENDPARCGFDVCRALVSGIREARVMRPDLVAKFGSHLLSKFGSRLGAEQWPTYEQTYIAHLQYGRHGARRAGASDDDARAGHMERAQRILELLKAQFVGSARVKRLEGMMCEAKGELNSAADEYHALRREDAFNISALKRQVAVARSRGKPAEAVEILAEHVATFTQVKGGGRRA